MLEECQTPVVFVTKGTAGTVVVSADAVEGAFRYVPANGNVVFENQLSGVFPVRTLGALPDPQGGDQRLWSSHTCGAGSGPTVFVAPETCSAGLVFSYADFHGATRITLNPGSPPLLLAPDVWRVGVSAKPYVIPGAPASGASFGSFGAPPASGGGFYFTSAFGAAPPAGGGLLGATDPTAGGGGGFSFGHSPSTFGAPTTPAPFGAPPATSGERFALGRDRNEAGGWRCQLCRVKNPDDAVKCCACGKEKP